MVTATQFRRIRSEESDKPQFVIGLRSPRLAGYDKLKFAALSFRRRRDGPTQRNVLSLGRHAEGASVRRARSPVDNRRPDHADSRISQEGCDCPATFSRERTDHL